jgi:hypothetical protein
VPRRCPQGADDIPKVIAGIAERLGTTPVIFPSGHAGCLGREYGQPGDLDAFAAKLREVLTQA